MHDDDFDYYDDWDNPLCSSCGRDAGDMADECDQCGAPLCSMCYEQSAGFCSEHPDENYDYDQFEELGKPL